MIDNTMKQAESSGSTAHPAPFNAPKVAKERPLEHRVGQEHIMRNGLIATVESCSSAGDVRVRFEDDVHLRCSYEAFRKGDVEHPTLSLSGGAYAGFAVETAVRRDVSGVVLYRCACKTCGKRGLFLPKEMAVHEKRHGESFRVTSSVGWI